eukprot:TRINITY_DN2430_c0_g1_i1.p2 TRINITY_DN2430_c0_g1~~TRINITY_DN2430_c0_g1_i1.p2  ORF type:complete len:127 (+),score=20.23 TRINITY_DN2430_c0_g1_i1:56-436(+)
MARRERPKILFDDDGLPLMLFNGVLPKRTSDGYTFTLAQAFRRRSQQLQKKNETLDGEGDAGGQVPTAPTPVESTTTVVEAAPTPAPGPEPVPTPSDKAEKTRKRQQVVGVNKKVRGHILNANHVN